MKSTRSTFRKESPVIIRDRAEFVHSLTDDCIDISGGFNFTIMLRSDGSIWGTGYNDYGQLGLDGTYFCDRFVQIISGMYNGVISVSCGYNHSAIVRKDGTLWVTGQNNYGVLGNTNISQTDDHVSSTCYKTFTQLGTATDWKSVHSGRYNMIALKTDGTMYSIGSNTYGQLGTGTSNNYYTSLTLVNTNKNIKKLLIHETHSAYMTTDNKLYGAGRRCMFGHCSDTSLAQPTFILVDTTTEAESPTIKDFGIGLDHTTIVTSSGKMYATGSNSVWQLGVEDYAPQYFFFKIVNNDTNWKAVYNGYQVTHAVKEDGTLWFCGFNREGQSGCGMIGSNVWPGLRIRLMTQVPNVSKVKFCSHGYQCSLIITEDNLVYATGQGGIGYPITTEGFFDKCVYMTVNKPKSISGNHGVTGVVTEYGQLLFTGKGVDCAPIPAAWTSYTFPLKTFTQFEEYQTYKFVACQSAQTFAITADGQLYACGSNYRGNLGLPSPGDITYLTPVGEDKDWSYVACGELSTFFVKQDGRVYSAGWNLQNNLCLGYTDQRNVFGLNEVTLLTKKTKSIVLSMGGFYSTYAIMNDGTLWAVGYNNRGQLGVGDTTDRLELTQVDPGSTWKKVVSGSAHTIGLKTDNTLWTCGRVGVGELGLNNRYGINSTNKYGTASFLEPIYNAKWNDVGCCFTASYGIRDDGTLWSTGSNSYGQLGLGSNITYADDFTKVGTDNDWKAIHSVGGNYIIVEKMDGTLYFFGANVYYEFGSGIGIKSDNNFLPIRNAAPLSNVKRVRRTQIL